MVSKLDDSVGTIVAGLASKDMLKNSIIVFTTDNGGPAAGFNHNAASNWPLRGVIIILIPMAQIFQFFDSSCTIVSCRPTQVKNTLWEGGVRGAGFIWSPLLKDTSRVSSQLMHIQDWLPTLIGGIGANVSQVLSGKNLDGINMWDTLNEAEEPSPRKQLIHNIDDIYGNEAVRVGDWKLMHGEFGSY